MTAEAPALVVLRRQLDERWPARDRSSDGILADRRHRLLKSDHNQGNAIDITRDDEHGPDLEVLVQEFRRQMVAYPAGRLAYLIYNGRIASRSDGFVLRRYRGPNPHTGHAHLSIRPELRGIERRWTVKG